MKTRLSKLWDSTRTSLWFVPCCLMLAAIILAFSALAFDEYLAAQPSDRFDWLYAGGPDGARALLATIAGSMITVAGVTFSITIVALTLASSQFGPRLLRNFMRDIGNQVVLGTFIATFLYCLLVLRSVRGADGEAFVPQVSVAIGLLLAVFSLGVLIYFIHHVSSSIEADNVVAAVCAECYAAIDSLFPEEMGDAPADSTLGDAPDIEHMEQDGHAIRASASGYLQAIDGGGLMMLTSQNDLTARLFRRPVDFIVAGTTLMFLCPASRVTEEIERGANHLFVLGSKRTPIQDVEFAINQLVEIATRALSPGVNDPFTAISCVDRLAVTLVTLARRKFPSRYRYDDEGNLRVIADVTDFEGALDASFNQIRQCARTNVPLLIRMLEAIASVSEQAKRPADRRALLRHAEMLYACRDSIPEERDRDDLERRYEAVRASYD